MLRVAIVSFLLSGAVAAPGQSSPAPLTCPGTLKATEKEHDFERVSIFNVDKAGREYELVPDNEARTGGKIVQVWNLKEYRDMTILVRCRYHDTAVVLNSEAPVSLNKCTFTFALDKKGTFIGKSDLVCRQ